MNDIILCKNKAYTQMYKEKKKHEQKHRHQPYFFSLIGDTLV